ncbi:MAG: DUF1801 domain-containing protein [Pseudomonadota bacterium]
MPYESVRAFNSAQSSDDRRICRALMSQIVQHLPDAEGRIWHGHPVWFLNGNQIVGYSKLKACIRLMFWSGADFAEPKLTPGTGKFKDASIRYTDAAQIDSSDLARWLSKARNIQWDYRDIYRREGKLVRLTEW